MRYLDATKDQERTMAHILAGVKGEPEKKQQYVEAVKMMACETSSVAGPSHPDTLVAEGDFLD